MLLSPYILNRARFIQYLTRMAMRNYSFIHKLAQNKKPWHLEYQGFCSFPLPLSYVTRIHGRVARDIIRVSRRFIRQPHARGKQSVSNVALLVWRLIGGLDTVSNLAPISVRLFKSRSFLAFVNARLDRNSTADFPNLQWEFRLMRYHAPRAAPLSYLQST